MLKVCSATQCKYLCWCPYWPFGNFERELLDCTDGLAEAVLQRAQVGNMCGLKNGQHFIGTPSRLCKSTHAFFVSGTVELMINTGKERIGPYVKSLWWGEQCDRQAIGGP